MLCACGCGQHTKLSKSTDAKRGVRKGEPLLYLQGHWFRKHPSKYLYKGREDEYRREWREANPETHRRVQRASWLKRHYGMTLEDEDALLKKQEGCCAICGTDKPGRRRRYKHFHVDHDRETGEIRGLLCADCNSGIGFLKHDAARMYWAIDYLSDWAARNHK